ncbi:carbohydrate ABC transporter permease [Allorhizobium sp. BGMRC 0089]|uniref:carbohydrate ABC transporter permease n=1 Tax=Allorhizobium sonneratiae TaxID=2934936 RepID=UPI0020346B0A|nr:carbohydrate ABC transporter permease [Allorhizobium sonneratiae]MCM2293136.1 carbohydrate ABC transporter permease [Allorhizobium sonneratiae]
MTDASVSLASGPDGAAKRHPLMSLAIHAVLIAVSLLMLYPLLWMISGSLKDQSQIFGQAALLPKHLDFSAYWRGWHGTQIGFGTYFWNSLVISVLSVIGNVFSCSLAAYAFARLQFKGRSFWFALMLGTLMLPYHVTLIPQYILFLKLGWVNTILPLVVPKFLAVDAFFIFLMVQFFRGIPRELDEAAMMDGCSPWRIYWRIMMPLSLPVLATAAIFTFIWTWDDFFGPLIYLSDTSSYTVQLGLRSFVDSTGSSDWSGLFAMSSLSLVPVFLIFLFFQRLLINGIATSGLKR